MTGTIKKHLRKQQLKSGGSIGSPSPSSSSGLEEPSSPPSHLYQRSKTGAFGETPSGIPYDGGSSAKARRPMGVERASSFSGDQEADMMEVRKELAEKGEELFTALRECRGLKEELEREREGRREAEERGEQLSAEVEQLQDELHEKTLLLNEHEVFLRKLQGGEDIDASIEELLQACQRDSSTRYHSSTNGVHKAGSDTPRDLRLAAAERESSFYEQEVERLRDQVEALQEDKADALKEVEHLRDELEKLKKHKVNCQGWNVMDGSFEGGSAELREEMERLRQELDEVKEDKEATVTELLSQVMALNSKLQSAKKEREAAVVAAERRMDVLKRELASVVERNEKNEGDVEKARVSIVKAEEYLKALDVARVEVKRLRLERDLLTDKLRTAEEVMKKKGASGVDMASWLMPNCLLQRDPEEPKFAPDTPR